MTTIHWIIQFYFIRTILFKKCTEKGKALLFRLWVILGVKEYRYILYNERGNRETDVMSFHNLLYLVPHLIEDYIN